MPVEGRLVLLRQGRSSGQAWVAGHAIRILAGLPPGRRVYLGYDHALRQGWPIATGVIEGACRHRVKDRMDITAARWSLAGAEAILRLRALISNGDCEEA